MKQQALELLDQWHERHQSALEAEYLAAHPEAAVFGDAVALAHLAAKLRASADEAFEQLMRQEGFGSLAPMPRIKPAR